MASILVIEDSYGQRAEICAALERSALFDRVLEASDGIVGLRLLLAERPDLVLCDLEMPGLDGEKLLRMSQSSEPASVPAPFVVLTAVVDPERRARLLEQGASDAITKPFHTADLIARLGLHLKLVRTQRELLQTNAELKRLSRTDPLTGLSNRRELDDVLAVEFKRARRYGSSFAVAIADLDHFKRVNDEHGHEVGDQVLVRVAETLNEIVRDTDCGGRFGGEEFLIVLGNNDGQGASVFAERFRASVESIVVDPMSESRFCPTVSVGVAAWDPEVESASALVRRADAALYRAKQAGRNRVWVHGERAPSPFSG